MPQGPSSGPRTTSANVAELIEKTCFETTVDPLEDRVGQASKLSASLSLSGAGCTTVLSIVSPCRSHLQTGSFP